MGFPCIREHSWSVLRRDGVPRLRSTTDDGAALIAARRRKERVYPEFTGQRGRTRLVVLAGEVGGRWSEECREFLNQLAKAKARREPRHLRARAGGTDGRLSWLGSDGDTPLTTELVSDHRYLPFTG